MEGEKEDDVRTRMGYKPADCLKAFLTAMNESGVPSIGKTLHFSADIICSGAYSVWARNIYQFCIDHIGIVSPRIFVYLNKRMTELDTLFHRIPDETLYNDPEFQSRVCEIIFVIKEQPRRTRQAWPKVPLEAHEDGWLRRVKTDATETDVVRRVYKSSSDLYPLYLVACELMKACSDSSSEKALFWVKWVLDEDAKIRKQNKGAGLSTADRGPPQAKKTRSDAGYYILNLLAEAYKEYSVKKMIRMDEEFQTLIDMYRNGNQHMTQTARKSVLGLIVQIICEVPRWRVPAAPTLIKDPQTLARTVQQSGHFFREILVEKKTSSLKGMNIFKSKKEINVKAVQTTVEQQLDAYELVMNKYLNN